MNIEKNLSFLMVLTGSRRFPVYKKADIINRLDEKEDAYEVRVITYIGDYEGKEDVISIKSGTETMYMTVVNENAIAKLCIIDNVKKWITYYNDTSLSCYYDVLREQGVLLRNDIYKREDSFISSVTKKIEEIKEQEEEKNRKKQEELLAVKNRLKELLKK